MNRYPQTTTELEDRRERARRILKQIGGRLVVSGTAIEGPQALHYLCGLTNDDFNSLEDDLNVL